MNKAIEDIYALTPMQQGMLFHTLMEPGNGVYVEQLTCRIGKGLDTDLFERALQQLVDRHAILRSVFAWEKLNEPVQVALKQLKIAVNHLDWRHRDADERAQAFAAFLEDDYTRGVTLNRPPLVRFTLIRLADDDARFVWTSHHILYDGWSFARLMTEFLVIYVALSRGETAQLPGIRPYRDYIAWLKSCDMDAAEAFWRARMGDFEQPTPLGLARHFSGREGVQKRVWRLDADATEALRHWTRQAGVTMNTLVQGVWAILLGHYSQQTDVLFGATVSGRPAEIDGIDSMVGLFINSLPVRVRIDPDARLGDWLRALQADNAQMRQYEFTPLTQIHGWSSVPPGSPLFRSILVFENYPIDESLQRAGDVLPVSDVQLREQDNYPLTLGASLSTTLEFIVNYDTRYFDGAIIERLCTHLDCLFSAIRQRPDTRVGALPIISAAQRRQVLVEWNDTHQPLADDSTLQRRFEAQVAATPHAVAVVSGEVSLTYAELDARATRVAGALHARGVGPESLVGICLERSAEMVVAVYGVWKAGAAYVPFDPKLPKERLAFMLEDAQPVVVLLQPSVAAHFPDSIALGIHGEFAHASCPAATATATGQNVAYVIYTSGSTGRPKGTQITQRAAVNMADAHATLFARVQAGPLRVAGNASLSFDVSVAEWVVLLHGHTLVIVPDEVRQSPEALLDFIQAQRIDAIDCPTLQLRYLLECGGASRLPRYVSVGGDAIDAGLWSAMQALPGTQCFNFYGPTECTVDVTVSALQGAGECPLIGKPQANARVYLLDAQLEPVPAGIAGELYVAGEPLARGYLKRPGLTAERFVPNPFAERPGERLYRSGDLARHLPDGSLEFLGRADDQVKVRGFRIEPGEIESALLATPPVSEAIVLPRETGQGDRQLVAYVAVNPTDEQARYWGESFDEIYDAAGPDDPTFNTVGWNSSYDSVPIPAQDMRYWLDSTLERILALQPRQVLELGCGTGMLLHGMAPHVTRYYGTDLSERVVAQLRRTVEAAAYQACDIQLIQRGAHEIDVWQGVTFDTVIVNSVAQYFPNLDYLLAVIERSIALIPERGQLFFGDMRHFGLLQVFHNSLELHKAQPSTLLSRVRESVARIESMETELLVDPAFFVGLMQRFADIVHVQLMPKAGSADNELTRFRYDVVLRIERPHARRAAAAFAPQWQAWDPSRSSVEGLAALDAQLAAGESACVALAGIPDARLEAHVAAHALVQASQSPRGTVADLRERWAAAPRHGIHLTDCLAVAARHGYHAQLSCGGGASGVFHCVFSRDVRVIDWRALYPCDALAATVNQPSSKQLLPAIQKHIVRSLRARLPEYMIPARFVILEHLPRSISGKIDRRALPSPEAPEAPVSHETGSLTPAEEILAGIWRDILEVGTLGASDNFFELGGHSLLATRVVSRVRAAFQADLPIRALFEAPTVRSFAQRIELAQREQAGTNLPLIEKREHTQPPPLSFAQQRLWFIDRLEGASSLYNMPVAVRLSGQLDLAALQRTLDEILRRHEALRTHFAERDGVPYQVIVAGGTLPIRLVDVTALHRGAREARIGELTEEEARRPFDLGHGPLVRAMVIRAGDNEHIALLTLHHVVADGWSIGVLVQELGVLYGAFVQGKPSPLSDLPIQYADFSVWQRLWLAEGVMQRQLDYWTEALRGAPTLLPFPTDRPRSAQRGHRGAHVGWVIDAELTEAVKALGRASQSTLFMVLMAAFDVLLARYSGENDVCVGTAVANRNRDETEPLIGLFVNTLVMRSLVEPLVSFNALLQQVRSTALKAYANQDVPFEHVVDAVAPVRSLGHQPLFQIMLLLQNTPDTTLALPGLSLQPLGASGSTAKCDLILNVTETADELHCDFEYDVDLFDATTLQRLAGHFRQLLRAIVAAPEAPIRTLSYFDGRERAELTERWNVTCTPWPFVAFISRFEIQAKATPQRIAVVSDGQQLTYRELDARADRIAHRLAAAGVNSADVVGVFTERSVEMLVAVLGAMKTGAAYVPLDPHAGPERLSFILGDARPACVLTQVPLLAELPPTQATLLCLEAPSATPVPNTPFRPAQPIAAEGLAYLIYTSGSTGTPKAVQVRQESLSNLLSSMQQSPGISADDTLLSVTSLAFDLVVPNLFLPLICGARTVYAARERTDDPMTLASLMEQHRVTLMQATPATWRMLLDNRWPTLAAPLKILCGGDALSSELAARLLARVPVVWNMYGPTETTVWSSSAPIDRPERAACVGRALANTQLFVLDAAGEPVPPGVAGELCIAGLGLARGYLNQPALTAEKFVPNPFASTPGQRMYRTGDLARYLADGNLEHLGRLDNQVKLRGFRIEPGEIERALSAVPGIGETVVLAHRFGDGDTRLVAYWVADEPAATLDIAAVRARLAARLPDYMVPSHFVELEQLPLTANGKLERRALPPPSIGAGARFEPPQTEVQRALAAIWVELLNVERVGLQDNFFESGGHSLLATRLIAHIRRDLAVDLPLRAVFEAPHLDGLAQRVEQAAQGPAAQTPITARSRGDATPLSAGQQRLWFLDQLQPGNPAYIIALAVRLNGILDVRAFAAAINAVVARHQVLRTRFSVHGGEPRQCIAEQCVIELQPLALDELPRERREALARRHIDSAAQAPFDLSAGPLLRVQLLRMAAQEHIAIVTLHHIVADGWSLGLLMNEVAELYRAHLEGRAAELPPLPVQYADFAVWQRERLEDGALQSQLAYWTGQLAAAPTLLALPTDRPRPAVQRHAGASLDFRVPVSTAQALLERGQRNNATLFMTLSAAFSLLLARYTGQTDICIGTPIANRRQAELEPLIGLFINTLVLRTQIDLQGDFDSLLAQVRDTALAAYAHQDVPFEQLVEALEVERHLSHTPVFQVMLVLQNAPAGDMELPGLHLQPLVADGLAAKFDLTLYVTEHAAGLGCTLEYSSDLFDAGTIERMARHFTRLLEAITEDVGGRIGELSLLDGAERHELVRGWNDTAVDYADRTGGSLHGPFEAQARRAPQAVAVVFEGASLTYAELDNRANALAHRLLALGVGPDQHVALCIDRSLDMMVALLAVLKAGAAYVPLDPHHPAERLAVVLADAIPAAVLTQSHLRERLPPLGETAVVNLDALPVDARTHPRPGLEVHPRQLAYVIYTSGSTGTPKGVGVDHGGICNRLAWMQASYPLAASERVLQKTPLTFDVSVWELFWPLREGATLVIARPGGHQDVAYLHGLIEAERISTLHFVPPMLEAFLQQPGMGYSSGLRQLICSGEALPLALQQRVFAQLPGVELHNLYGPTEASVDVTAWTCVPQPDHDSVPIGRPIGNIQIHLLDALGQPVPAGVAGELYIAGVGLARGYLNRPALTADHFVPNPFATTPGQRMYRSGDLARYRADGAIEYLGRLDNQIKLRGLRIEPGEIETALLALPGVREASVLARRFGDGDSRLVAYWVLDRATDTESVRSQLATSLPDYMVPAHFVRLERLPLTANGKLDRRALPLPASDSGAPAYVAPVSAVEQALARIWVELLKREPIGLHEHFFEAGGHSLLATRMLAHIRRDLAVELPLQDVFEAPTLIQLAQRVERAGPRADEAPLRAVRRQGPAPLSAGQKRLWFIDQLQPGNPAYIIPLAVRLRGRLDTAAFTEALNAVVARHEVLRTTFVLDAGEPRQQIASRLRLEIPLRDFDHLPVALRDSQVSELIADAAQAPFDLATGPLLRVQLLRIGAAEHVAILTLHHIVADGWSLGLLLHEVAESYTATLQRRAPRLPALTVQYADFAEWQSERDVGAQLDYWTGQLKQAPTLLALPTDRPRPSVQRHQGAALDFEIDPAIAQGLNALGRTYNATLFMTLLAAFDVLLARYAGQDDICVGTPIANRRQAALEPLIGLFINTLVLRNRVDLGAPFATLLNQVRDIALVAYAHQDLPFEQLVEALDVERHLSHTPVFQVMLVLQNAPVSDMRLPDLALEPLAADAHAAKFDLTLYVTEQAGGLSCSLEYSTDLFDAATAARFTRHFARLLQSICADPTQRVGELAMLDAEERQCLLHEWNATTVDVAAGHRTLQGRFERQVRLTPDAVAVVAENQRLTYRELNARANQLAHGLRAAHGLGAEQRVAVCVERSVAMMVGLLAVLKTGAAYIPFDPASPAERLATMLQDAAPRVLLTQSHLAASLAQVTDLPVLLLDAEPAQWHDQPTDDLGIDAWPDQLAYVIYTSGSSGTPKGVMISHGSLLHYLDWAASAYPLRRDVGSFMQLPLVFDAAITPLYLPLLAGKAVHLPQPDAGAELFAFLKQPHDLSLLKITPAHIELIAVSMARHEVATRILTTVIGGEALSAAQARTWLGYFPETTIVNEYGPTETTVGCCVQSVHGTVPYDTTVPIGKPIANTQLRVLDNLGNPVPVGVAGELHIAGAGLGRGYLNRPGLSAEKFVPDPFGTQPGARMYRSGDLARYLADGTLEYLGRIDNQLKIRGFRIEPGEIEALIAGLPGIRDVFVTAWDNPADPTRRSTALVAYVVAEADAEGDMTTLRGVLRDRLPAYMLPTYFVELEHLPLTSNGKVDRRALPAPAIHTTADADPIPLSTTEAALAAIWTRVLRLDQVGRQDNFFELGGNSLLAVQLVNHAAAQFGVALPIRVAFEFQTLATMARYIEEIGLLKSLPSAADAPSDASKSIRI